MSRPLTGDAGGAWTECQVKPAELRVNPFTLGLLYWLAEATDEENEHAALGWRAVIGPTSLERTSSCVPRRSAFERGAGSPRQQVEARCGDSARQQDE